MKDTLDAVYNIDNEIITLTNSEKAKLILDDWDNHRPKFIKVMPTEYKLALEKLAKEKINQIIN